MNAGRIETLCNNGERSSSSEGKASRVHGSKQNSDPFRLEHVECGSLCGNPHAITNSIIVNDKATTNYGALAHHSSS